MFIFKLIFSLLFAQISKWMGSHPGFGLLIGLFFGHILDTIIYKKIVRWTYQKKYRSRAKEAAQADFIFTLFSALGQVAGVDGKIDPKELTKFEEISTTRLKLKKKDLKIAKKIFNESNNKRVPIQSLCTKLVEIFGADKTSILNSFLTFKEMALCDGKINEKEYDILFTIGTVFGFPTAQTKSYILGDQASYHTEEKRSELKKESKFKDPLTESLEILGCTSSDSDEKIRKNYRELVSKFHPDKIISKELPQDFVDFATKKFTDIKAAYDLVKQNRKFN